MSNSDRTNRHLHIRLRTRTPFAALLAALLSSAAATGAFAADAAILDCPLRDQAYSVELPLFEILLKPEAVMSVNKHLDGFVGRLPPAFARTETPSFATIISLRMAAGFVNADPQAVEALDAELATLDVTDDDRRARCARYADEVPELERVDGAVNVLVFDRINGFDHGPSVDAATRAIEALAEQMGWHVAVTDQPGVFAPETLGGFDAVVWNNVSGDVLTLTQRHAFRDYIDRGGGFLGIHASGGDPLYLWDWYADTLLGARFIGHPSDPQFQDARIEMETPAQGIADGLPRAWNLKDEWYSFASNPRERGVTVVATLDESTYTPEDGGGRSLRMGDDHPIAWARCVNGGRAMYTAIGHRPEVYHIPENLTLLRNALVWTVGKGRTTCPVSE